jgi:hypothetical protein
VLREDADSRKKANGRGKEKKKKVEIISGDS